MTADYAPRRVEIPRVHESVLPKVDRLHEAHVAAAGPPLDLAPILLHMIREGRGDFVGGGSWSSSFRGDRIEAVIHAAQHGYTLCEATGERYNDENCWLPVDHHGDCLFGHGWEWSLAYRADHTAPNVTCTHCKPVRRMRRGETCPHMPVAS